MRTHTDLSCHLHKYSVLHTCENHSQPTFGSHLVRTQFRLRSTAPTHRTFELQPKFACWETNTTHNFSLRTRLEQLPLCPSKFISTFPSTTYPLQRATSALSNTSRQALQLTTTSDQTTSPTTSTVESRIAATNNKTLRDSYQEPLACTNRIAG